MLFCNIPTTIEDFKRKEKEWEGFEKALRLIGLNKYTVLERQKKGRPPYKSKEEQDIKCQKGYKKYTNSPRRVITKLESNQYVMTKAKSKASRPEEKTSKVY